MEIGYNLENLNNIEGVDSDLNVENVCVEDNIRLFRREGGKEFFGDLKFFVFGELLIVLII